MVDRRSLLSPAAAAPARRARSSNNYAEFFGANDSIDDILGEGKGEDGYGGDGAYMTLDAQALDTPFSPQGETDGLEPSREERCLRCVRAFDECFDRVPCFDSYVTVRYKVWQVVSGRASKYGQRTKFWPSLIFEGLIIALIFVNIIMAILISEDSYQEDPNFTSAYGITEVISTLIFSAEFALRLWAAPAGREKHSKRLKRSKRTGELVSRRHGCCSSRLRWILSPLSVLDAVVLLGFYIDSFAIIASSGAKSGMTALRLLRLLSVFRFERHSKGLKHLKTVLSRKVPELILALFVSAILLLVSSTLIYAIEGSEYPDFDSISKALYWSAMTVTTVGYGDVVPHTPGGRVIASFIAFLGVCLFALPSAVLGSGLIEVMTEGRHKAYVERQRARARALKQRRRGQTGTIRGMGVASNNIIDSRDDGGELSSRGGGAGVKRASAGVALEMTSTQMGRSSLDRRDSVESVDSEGGLQSPYGKVSQSSPRFAAYRRGTGNNGGGNDGLPAFSQVFDVHNPLHVVAAASVLLGEDSEIFSSQQRREGMIVPRGFWEQFGPETGGLVGLHAVLTRKLAEEYLFQSIKNGITEDDEDDEENSADLGRGGAAGRNDQEDPGFFKL